MKTRKRKLENEECIDIAKCRTNAAGIVQYNLGGIFHEDVDYCDAEREEWIWSIGKHNKTGEYHAATDTRFYQHTQYECVFLR